MEKNRIIVLIQMAVVTVMTIGAQNPKAFLQDYTSPAPAGAGTLITHHSHHSSFGNGNPGFNGPAIGNNGPGWAGNGFGPSTPMWGTTPGMMTGGCWGNISYSGPDNPPPVVYNNGILHLVAVGYDAQGVWQTVPIIVQYQWNGVGYDPTVLDAWNPWTQSWQPNLDLSAFQTQYLLRGQTYNWYVNLPTGTYYFNL